MLADNELQYMITPSDGMLQHEGDPTRLLPRKPIPLARIVGHGGQVGNREQTHAASKLGACHRLRVIGYLQRLTYKEPQPASLPYQAGESRGPWPLYGYYRPRSRLKNREQP